MSKTFPLEFLTESLPTFVVGAQSSFQLQATGGTEPYTFKITSGALPASLTLSPGGIISGVVRKAVDDTTVSCTLTDAKGAKVTQAFNVQVAAPARKA